MLIMASNVAIGFVFIDPVILLRIIHLSFSSVDLALVRLILSHQTRVKYVNLGLRMDL